MTALSNAEKQAAFRKRKAEKLATFKRKTLADLDRITALADDRPEIVRRCENIAAALDELK